MYAGAGIDTIHIKNGGEDTLFDMVTGLTNFAGESFIGFENVSMSYGDDTVIGDSLDNHIYGGGGNDNLNGGDGKDTIYGDVGNDVLNGGSGDDFISGDAGNDVLIGGLGRDFLAGGSGASIYDFNSALDSPAGVMRDQIKYFDWKNGDKIDLSTIDADLTIPGNQPFSVLGQISYDPVSHIFTADVVGGDDLSIEIVGGGVSTSFLFSDGSVIL